VRAAAFDAISNPAAWKSACAQLRVVTFKVKTWEKLVMHPMPYLALALMLGRWRKPRLQMDRRQRPGSLRQQAAGEGQAAETLDIQSQPTPAAAWITSRVYSGPPGNCANFGPPTGACRSTNSTVPRPEKTWRTREPPHIATRTRPDRQSQQRYPATVVLDHRQPRQPRPGNPRAKDELRQIYRKYGIKQ